MSFMNRLSSHLSGLSLGARLSSAFGLLLLLAALLGGVAMFSLSQVSAASSALATKSLPAAGHIAAARAAMLEARDFESKAARAADASYLAEYDEKMKVSLGHVKEQMGGYAAVASTDGEREALAKFQKSWSEYLKFNDKVLALARENKMDDARDISDGAADMASTEAITAIDELSAASFSDARDAAENAAKVYSSARFIVIGLVASSLAIGFALALLITRSVLGQLGGEPSAATAVARAVAGGDLSTPIHLKRGDTQSLMASLADMQTSLSNVVRTVRQGSDSVATASAEIASGNNDLSMRTEQQASALEETSASMEQLGSTVRQNTDNAREADELARTASSVAQRGGEAVNEVVGTMKGINESSRRIADITGVIDGIAFQTNILALNAAVEAARAGEQGRGFAVVAGEVRTLAQRSAEAAREIKSLIAASVERVEQGTAQVDRAGETMTEVVTSIQRVSQIMAEIANASVEQQAGVRQVGQAVTEMDQSTQQNAALVEQSAAAAESLKIQAQQLVQAVAVFKV